MKIFGLAYLCFLSNVGWHLIWDASQGAYLSLVQIPALSTAVQYSTADTGPQAKLAASEPHVSCIHYAHSVMELPMNVIV